MNYVMTIMHHWQFISVLLKYIDIAFHNTFFSFNESHIVRLMLYSKNEYIISFDMENREGLPSEFCSMNISVFKNVLFDTQYVWHFCIYTNLLTTLAVLHWQ